MEKHKLKVHGELLSTPPMQKGGGYKRSSFTLQLQEHPGAQWGLVYTNRAQAGSETEPIRRKILPKGCKQLLPGRMRSLHHILSAQYTLLFISYLLSPGASFQYKYHFGLLHLFKRNLRNTAAHIHNSGFRADGQALALSAPQAPFEPDFSSQWPFMLLALILTNCNYHCFAFVCCLFFLISSTLYSKVADTRLKTHKGKRAYFITILFLGTVFVEFCTSFVDGSILSFRHPGLFHTVVLAVTHFCNFDR